MNFSFGFIVALITALTCTAIGLLHLIPPLWSKWDKLTQTGPWVHHLVGIFNLGLGVANFILLVLLIQRQF